MYSRLWDIARRDGLGAVVDGANLDDGADYRPGIRAARALGVRSPLAEAGLTKADIRRAARELGLPNWDRPASPCLSSRFPYGEEITGGKLAMVQQAEKRVRELGFEVARVRHHGTVARVEVPPERLPEMVSGKVREAVVRAVQEAGYTYVTLDMQGFRTGSMNETLDPSALRKEQA